VAKLAVFSEKGKGWVERERELPIFLLKLNQSSKRLIFDIAKALQY
jgi:hypothetical protein